MHRNSGASEPEGSDLPPRQKPRIDGGWTCLTRLLLRLLLMAVTAAAPVHAGGLAQVKTVFILMFENHDWSSIRETNFCPYLNTVLLPQAAWAEHYYNPTNNHPSEPNYLWLVSGTNFGIKNDKAPSANGQTTTNHLAFLLDRAGVSWKTYQEDISGTDLPLVNKGEYAVRHNPFMFFASVTNDPKYCLAHVRPMPELFRDLTNGTLPRFNFIVPNLTNDMHNLTPGSASTRLQGDQWMARVIPIIQASAAYQDGGAIFITWDEGVGESSDGPIGFILLSPFGRGGGYHNTLHYTHSSTLRTVQEVFEVQPFLGDAANVMDLSDLFQNPQLQVEGVPGAATWRVLATGLAQGRLQELQGSPDLQIWTPVATRSATNGVARWDLPGAVAATRFYRVVESR